MSINNTESKHPDGAAISIPTPLVAGAVEADDNEVMFSSIYDDASSKVS